MKCTVVLKEALIVLIMIALCLFVFSASAMAEVAKDVVRQVGYRMADEFTWSPLTFTMCVAGWLISLLSEWASKWNLMRLCLKDFIIDNFPRVTIGLISVLCCYILIPELIVLFDLDMKMNNLGAFVTGLSADVIVHRIRGLIPRSPEARDVEREKVRTRLDAGAAKDAKPPDTRP